jgi:small-conductance mechanosensitive channel
VLSNHKELLSKLAFVLLITGAGLLAFYVIFRLLKRWSKSQKWYLPVLLEKYVHKSGVMFFIIITLNINIEIFRDHLTIDQYLFMRHFFRILMIISIGHLLIKIVTLLRELLLLHYKRAHLKDYMIRSAKTKLQIVQQIINVLILIGALSAIMITFEQVRQFGGALLASAGVAGIALGFAAQKSLGTLLAGIQIAISQPVKIGDIVVVEEVFGTVGEITLTYIVVNTWDEKRLIVPINYFLDKPFMNWTRISPEVIGQVKIYADYTMPVSALREKFKMWLASSKLWDGRSSGLQVTGANSKTIEIRATMSAQNSGDAYDLECLIRENMVTYIREEFPEALPASRITVTPAKANNIVEK